MVAFAKSLSEALRRRLLFVRLRLLGGQGGVHQGLEGVHVGDGQVGKDLPIHFHAGQLEAVDQVGVVGAADAGAGVDTGDPEAAILALLVLAAHVGVGHGLHHLLGGCPILLGLGAEIAFGQPQDLAALLDGIDASLNSCHGSHLLTYRESARGLSSALPRRYSRSGAGRAASWWSSW